MNIILRSKNKKGCINLKGLVTSLILFCLLQHPIFPQASQFSPADKEEIQKAQEIKDRANEEQLKTNELYQQMTIVEQDVNYSTDRKLQQEYKKLEDQALKIEIKAAELYGESNKVMWNIYKKYIEEFWAGFTGDKNELINALLLEEKGFEYLYRASSLRESAKRSSDQQQAVSKLTEAYELEIMGLEKLEVAYDIYKKWPDIPDNANTTVRQEEIKDPTSSYSSQMSNTSYSAQYPEISETTSGSTPAYSNIASSSIDKVELDLVKIQRFQAYIDEHQNDSLLLQSYISGYDMNSIQQFWDLYRNMDRDQYAISFGGDDDNVSRTTDYTDLGSDQSLTDQAMAESIQTGQYEKTGYGTVGNNEEEIGIVSENIEANQYKIIYRVQIARNKTPLSQGLLQRIYQAGKSIGTINEEGWYKYSIGDFMSYNEADEFRNNLGIEEAFIVAYREQIETVTEVPSLLANDNENNTVNTSKISPVVTSLSTTTQTTSYRPDTYEGTENMVFIIQIAASRSPLSENDIQRLYSGPEEVKLRKEDGWYKYQIGHKPTYTQAKEVLKTVRVHGAFIAAYKGSYKYKLWEAIRITREGNNEIVFKLQIAASRVKMDGEDLSRIYKGRDKIDEIFENGLYKYQIPVGNNYENARRVKNLWGIKGSFIVPYRGKEKLDIKKAIEMTK